MIIKKICLITPGHISSNPRLVKEAIALHHAGWSIHIIFTQYMDYLVYQDTKILEANPEWTYDYLLWTPTHKILRLKTAIVQRLAKLISHTLDISNLLINRNYYWQLKTAVESHADLYIAHNLTALPVAVNAAKKNKVKCGFDAEDFHRNEASNDPDSADVRLKTFIEDKYLKQTDYITVASPLIYKAYNSLYPNLNPIIINNVFELKHQPKLNLGTKTGLKLFWFSQTIGKNRGLEDVIEALNLINNPLIELHLLGSSSVENASYFNQMAHFEIKYYSPVSPDQIFELAATFDLGLAMEQNSPLNRDICLTNKIFTYLISGLAIIASDTQAQKEFMTSNALIGELYSIGDVTALADIITKLFNNRDLLNIYRENSYELAKSKYNWEKEQEKFLAIIKSLLS
ncbi:hypothetical protein [Pedobacter sp. N23S346]|uniref:hypothetical protein n=1 Tax=Pedobacter sp. N23S346 TaxID=3402750 RepID=UPI003AC4C016